MRVSSLLGRSIVVAAGTVTFGSALIAQTPPAPATPAAKVNYAYRYRLLGVYDAMSGDPVEGVEVADILAGNKSLTSVTGTVSLLFLPEGVSMVRLRKVGYEVQTITVQISPSDTAPLTIIMTKATQLPTTVITDSAPKNLSPHMRAFDEHKKEGMGQFLDETFMRKNDNRTLANALSGLSGVHASPGLHGATYLVSSRKQCSGPAMRQCNSPDCFIRVYTDGTLTYDANTGSSRIDFGRLSTADYAAAEFYPGGSALPAGISPTNADCGTLVLYTREK